MALTQRQTNLLVNQDWKLVYQSFKEADFQSYDFETIRKTMIDYLRTYYPEDFNDFTESSEYIALIDLIAFLGQSLAFRTDLNARENFFDTAERRDSILKLSRLVSYNPKRNIPASGLLKIDSVSTTESVFDSNGSNLSNLIISWNDVTNPDWLEQFTVVLNSSLINSQILGKPGNSQLINGIQTDEYSINLVQGVIATYGFKSIVEGSAMNFEAVSASTVGQSYIYEVDPKPSGKFNVLYRNDNQGNGSPNTGYFVYFKQGSLNSASFNLSQGLPDRVINVNFDNINNSDVWLYSLDTDNNPDLLWTKVPALAGINIIYNRSSDRNLYQINTRANDQIDVVFGDGSFANIPQGVFRLYYRVSNGQRYKITPDELQGVVIPISYVSRNNRIETLTIRASLQYTVANSDIREVSNDIRVKAPQQYYTQNRMITGEDYNIFPYTNFNSIVKIKAVNRSSSGISRFLDTLDTTGKYSSTNVFANDGILYKNEPLKAVVFGFANSVDVNDVFFNVVTPLLSKTELKHFYYENFPRETRPTDFTGITWYRVSADSNASSGYLVLGNLIQSIGRLTTSSLKYVVIGSLLKFSAGTGKYFDTQNRIVTGTPSFEGEKLYLYAAVVSTTTNNGVNLSQNVPSNAVLEQIIPVFKNELPGKTFLDQATKLIQSYKNFGIRYDIDNQSYEIILPQDLNPNTTFSLTNAGNTSGTGLDNSWLIKFEFNGTTYTAIYRSLEFIFQSASEVRFYFDPKVTVYDSRTGTIIHDQIKLLRVNNKPDVMTPLAQDQTWFIYNTVIEADGYIDTSKMLITFTDTNFDGVPDNPDLFSAIVTTDTTRKYVFFKKTVVNGYDTIQFVSNSTVVSKYATESAINQDVLTYLEGQIFYATTDNKFFILSIDENNERFVLEITDYYAYVGRQDLYFQHRHNSPNDRRIDPSTNNIMDLYILNKQYADDYLAWIRDTSGTVSEPSVLTNEELKMTYGSGESSLENYKAMSDTIIYNSGKFKPVFGLDPNKVRQEFAARFLVVKNPNIIISDNDIKTSVVSAINTFFDINNWDFGETFYFSELSTYLHNALSPNIASIMIAPANKNLAFGSLMQISTQPDEVIVSAATVDNVEIIQAITATQINQTVNNIIL